MIAQQSRVLIVMSTDHMLFAPLMLQMCPRQTSIISRKLESHKHWQLPHSLDPSPPRNRLTPGPQIHQLQLHSFPKSDKVVFKHFVKFVLIENFQIKLKKNNHKPPRKRDIGSEEKTSSTNKSFMPMRQEHLNTGGKGVDADEHERECSHRHENEATHRG